MRSVPRDLGGLLDARLLVEDPAPQRAVFTVHLDVAAALDERRDRLEHGQVIASLLAREGDVDDVTGLVLDGYVQARVAAGSAIATNFRAQLSDVASDYRGTLLHELLGIASYRLSGRM